MKPSKFNICAPSSIYSGQFFHYNTLFESAIVLSAPLANYRKRKNNFNVELLNKIGFLVENNVDEDLLLYYWFHKKQMATDILRIEIMPTLKCNFMCDYCIADPIKSEKYMNKKIVDLTIYWIKQKISEDRPKRVFLQFSGGEPLLYKEAIFTLCQSLKRYCKERNIIFELGLFSNGSLADATTIRMLNRLSLKNLQITLDGPPDTHNKRRPFISGVGSFDIILKNLCAIAPLLDRLSLRINIDFQNYKEVPRLLKIIKDKINTKNVFIQIARVIEIDRKSKVGYKRRRMHEFDQITAQRMLMLYQTALKMGFKIAINKDSVFAPYGMCMFTSANSFVIDSDGFIYKCVGSVGRMESVIGTIRGSYNSLKEIMDSTVALRFRKSHECRMCPFLPVCSGGCRNLAFLDSGNFFKVICHRNYFKEISIELLELLYSPKANQ